LRADFPFDPAKLPFYYGWVIVAVATLAVCLSVPGQTMGISVFTDPLLEATSLSRLQLSNAYLIGTVASGLLLPYAGSAVDRFGARRSVLVVCLGLAGTLVFLAHADRVAQGIAGRITGLDAEVAAFGVLALAFAGVRFTGQGMLTLVARTMTARWFERRRGLVSAISGPFVNLAFAVAPLVLAAWIARAGWRGAWLEMAAGIGIGMGFLGWLLFRESPESCGIPMEGRATPQGEDRPDARPAPPPTREFTRGEAIRRAGFWLLVFGVGNQALIGTGITFHIVDLGAEAGLDAQQAVAIFLPIAIVSTTLGFAAGAAVDRLPIRLLMVVMMLGQLGMTYGAAHLGDPTLRIVGIGCWGLSSAFFGPFMVAALPAFFGVRHIGAIQGALMMGLVIASALGPSALALAKDLLGSYAAGLYVLMGLPFAVAIAAPFVPHPQAEASETTRSA